MVDIDIEIRTIGIHQLVDYINHGVIRLDLPAYSYMTQWSRTQQSQYIESIIIGLPLPTLYFEQEPKTRRWIAINGYMQISTIHRFVYSSYNFALTGLELLADSYIGKTYGQLSFYDKVQFNNRPITLNIFSGTPDPHKRYLMYRRLNARSEVSDQELRSIVFHGPATDLLGSLANVMQNRMPMAVPPTHMLDQQYVARVLSMMIDTPQITDDINRRVNLTMDQINKGDIDTAVMASNFTDTLDYCIKLLDRLAFRSVKDDVASSRISPSLFESTMIAIHYLDKKAKRQLLRDMNQARQRYSAMFADPMYSRIFTRNAAQRTSQVANRVHLIESYLLP